MLALIYPAIFFLKHTLHYILSKLLVTISTLLHQFQLLQQLSLGITTKKIKIRLDVAFKTLHQFNSILP
jgi:hypothetical protein